MNLRKNLHSRNLIIAIATILMLLAVNVSASIEPSNYEPQDQQPGDEYTIEKTVTIPTTPLKVDVMFAFDLTSSMHSILETAKSNLSLVMDNLDATGINFSYGLISYMDYPDSYDSCNYSNTYGSSGSGDYPYSLDQPLTTDSIVVETAINSLTLGRGIDLPECYTRIFYESYSDSNIGWRTGAKKILVNFGDNIPHDCNINEGVKSGTWTTGRDPGRDEVVFTDDDLDLQLVLGDMASNNIILLQCQPDSYYLQDYWDYWTGITGGSVNIVDTLDFAADVVNIITNEITISKVYGLHLEVTTSGYESWLGSVDPLSYDEVDAGDAVTFNETISIPEDADPKIIHTFIVSALDEDGVNFGDQTNVLDLNSPPQITTVDNTTAFEDIPYYVVYEADDPDGDDLTWDYATNAGFLSFDINTGVLSGTPDNSDVGTYYVNISVFDDKGESDYHNFTLIVLNVNDPPVIQTTDDPTAVEDINYYVDYDAIDVEGDTLSWSLDTDAGFLSINTDTGVLSGIPDNSDVGSYYVNVSVNDGNGGIDFHNFTLTVINVNDPPDAPKNPNPSNNQINVGINPTLSVDVTDPDGDLLNVTFYDASDDTVLGWVKDVASGGVASVVWNGLTHLTEYTWYVVVNDSEYATTSDTFKFTTVHDNSNSWSKPGSSTNEKPVADSSAGEPYHGFAGVEMVFDGSLSYDTDSGGYIVNWIWTFGDGESGIGEITTHTYAASGNYTASLKVVDNKGSFDIETFNVIIVTGNNPPEDLDVDGPLTGKKNIVYSYTASATDIDPGDRLRFRFNWGDGTNTTSEIVESGEELTVNHSWSSYGAYEVEVTVIDNSSSQISISFTVEIDVIVIDGEDIKGYLVDEDSTDPFDIFDNTETGEKTGIEQEESTYLIDKDGDGDWDHAYHSDTGVITYFDHVFQKYTALYQQELATPGFEFISVLIIVLLAALIIRYRKKE